MASATPFCTSPQSDGRLSHPHGVRPMPGSPDADRSRVHRAPPARGVGSLRAHLAVSPVGRARGPVEVVQCRALTARAITRTEVSRAATLSILISSLARVVRGMVSVGLNAVELVTETYR